jgi:hypothetical protein
VFDEINDVNQRKIAITTEDGITQCYAEIEKWDTANKKAWLCTKVNFINEDTAFFFLYYDSSQPDNDTYVGGRNSTPAEAVWDAGYQGVYHLDEDPAGGDALDSTANHCHGDATGGLSEVAGKAGDCYDFDGINGKVDLGNPAGFDAANITVEAWIKTTIDLATDARIVQNGSGATNKWILNYAGGTDTGIMSNTDANHATAETDAVINDNAWHHLVGTTNPEAIYMDGVLQSATKTDLWSFEANTKIGSRGSTYYFDGLIDEVRISNVIRDKNWALAGYKTGEDDLINYSDEEVLYKQFGIITGFATF